MDKVKEQKFDIFEVRLNPEYAFLDINGKELPQTASKDDYKNATVKLKDDIGEIVTLKCAVPDEDTIIDAMAIDGVSKAGRLLYGILVSPYNDKNPLDKDEYTVERVQFYNVLANTYVNTFKAAFKKK